MMSMAYLDLLLVYMRIYILFSTIQENQMIFVLYSAAVQIRPDQSIASASPAIQHLNKYVLSTCRLYTLVRTCICVCFLPSLISSVFLHFSFYSLSYSSAFISCSFNDSYFFIFSFPIPYSSFLSFTVLEFYSQIQKKYIIILMLRLSRFRLFLHLCYYNLVPV